MKVHRYNKAFISSVLKRYDQLSKLDSLDTVVVNHHRLFWGLRSEVNYYH